MADRILTLAAFLASLFVASFAWGASSIDPTLPVDGLPYSSTPIRNNFQAAINDINSLQNLNIGPNQPFPCNSNASGSWWVNNSQQNWVYNTCDGPHGAWIGIFSLDSVHGVPLPGPGLSPVRTVLGANLNMYVAPTGTDTNNTCLTQGTPCGTIQHAFNLLRDGYDFDGFTVTVNLAPGTYSIGLFLQGKMMGQSNAGNLVLQGSPGNPDSVVISDTRPNNFALLGGIGTPIEVDNGAQLTVTGMRLVASVDDLSAYGGSTISFSSIDFGPTGDNGFNGGCQVAAGAASLVGAAGNYTISAGTSRAHYCAFDGGIIYAPNNQTPGSSIIVNMIGTPTFTTNFAWVYGTGGLYTPSPNISFTGTATGGHFDVEENGFIVTNTNNVNFLPGSKPGTIGSGGQYDSTVAERIKLFAPLTLYVSTTGVDSTGPSACMQVNPCLTVQNAFNVLSQSYDIAGQNVTVQLADGTYNQGVGITGNFTGTSGNPPSEVTPPLVTLQGNITTPANVVMTGLCCGNTLANVYTLQGAAINVKGISFTSSANEIWADTGSHIDISNCIFGTASGDQLVATSGGYLQIDGSYSITGSANAHILTQFNGVVWMQGPAQVTLVGTPNFPSGFIAAFIGGVFGQNAAQQLTFSGSATGPRYNAELNGVIQSATGNANYFPGNSAGIIATGGQYN